MLTAYLLITLVIFVVCLLNGAKLSASLGGSVFWPLLVACLPLTILGVIVAPVFALAEKLNWKQFLFLYLSLFGGLLVAYYLIS